MKGDDYWNGRHFWTHFWCGLVIGGIWGADFSRGQFESVWACAGLAVLIAVTFALAVGNWGDPLWRWLLEHW